MYSVEYITDSWNSGWIQMGTYDTYEAAYAAMELQQKYDKLTKQVIPISYHYRIMKIEVCYTTEI